MLGGLKGIFFSLEQVFCFAVEVFRKHMCLSWLFSLSSCGLSRVAFSIETMDGAWRWPLFFGTLNAKFIEIAMWTPVFVQLQSYERAAGKGIPVLALGVLLCGQVVKMPQVL